MKKLPAPDAQFLRVCVYGLGGSRKTFLSTHLPTTGNWAGQVVYIAADRTSAPMESIHPADRERLIPYEPDGSPNWADEMVGIGKTKWKEKHPEASIIVYDTVTANGYSVFLDKWRGVASDRKDSATLPMYNMAQVTVIETIDWLIRQNPEMHIICLFHECLSSAKDGLPPTYGPASVGSQGPRQIPQYFGANLWLEVEAGLNPETKSKKGLTKVCMVDSDKRIANVKAPTQVPQFKWIGPDPEECREFWSWLQAVKRGNPK